MKKLTNIILATVFGAGFGVGNKVYSQNTGEEIKKQYESDYENSKGKRGEGYYKERSERSKELLNKDWGTGEPASGHSTPRNSYKSPYPENVSYENKVKAALPDYAPKSSQVGSAHESYMEDLKELKKVYGAEMNELEKKKAREAQLEKKFEESWFGDENQQKKANAEIQAKKSSKELSDFVEKQAGYSPETKIWFDEEAKKADEFYKEFYKNDPKAYAETQKYDKLHKVIGYNAYKMGEKTPAGPVLEGMEKYEEIKEKGIENYWKEEVKEADEFLKQYESNPKLKVISDEKRLEEILGTDVHVPKIEKDKYSEQINKIAYESDVSKVIRYRAYQYAKNHTEAGKVIEGVEKIEQMKKNNTGSWWGE